MTQQAMTPMTNTASPVMIGFGAPIVQVYDVTSFTTAGGTITLTSTRPFTKGYIRVKSTGLAAAGTPSKP